MTTDLLHLKTTLASAMALQARHTSNLLLKLSPENADFVRLGADVDFAEGHNLLASGAIDDGLAKLKAATVRLNSVGKNSNLAPLVIEKEQLRFAEQLIELGQPARVLPLLGPMQAQLGAMTLAAMSMNEAKRRCKVNVLLGRASLALAARQAGTQQQATIERGLAYYKAAGQALAVVDRTGPYARQAALLTAEIGNALKAKP